MYLKNTEITDNMVIILEYANAESKPFYVAKKKTGSLTGLIGLKGDLLEDIVTQPTTWSKSINGYDLIDVPTNGFTHKSKSIKGSRYLTMREKKVWIEKLITLGHNDLAELLKLQRY